MKAKISILLAVFVSLISTQAQSHRRVKTIVKPQAKAFVASNPVDELPIRRVILYSNGVSYIERRGTVTGNAEINLSFKQSQVDDVLKSMLVLDLGQGKIGAVSYNSSAPASARTAEIAFNVAAQSEETDDDLGGMASVLSQLQGA